MEGKNRLGCNVTINQNYINYSTVVHVPVPVAARSKAYVYGRLLAEIVSSDPTGGMDVCRL